MFSMTDQFGAIWESHSGTDGRSGEDRTPVRIDYEGSDPLFIIYSWVSHRSCTQITFVSRPNELNGIARKYSKSVNAGLERVVVSLPPSLTNTDHHKIVELTRLVLLVNSKNSKVGYEYTTSVGTYSDFDHSCCAHPDAYVLFEASSY